MSVYSLASSTWDEKELSAIKTVIASDMFTMGKHVAEYEIQFVEEAKFKAWEERFAGQETQSESQVGTGSFWGSKVPSGLGASWQSVCVDRFCGTHEGEFAAWAKLVVSLPSKRSEVYESAKLDAWLDEGVIAPSEPKHLTLKPAWPQGRQRQGQHFSMTRKKLHFLKKNYKSKFNQFQTIFKFTLQK